MPNPWAMKLERFAPLTNEDRRHLDEIMAHPVAVEADKDLISEGDAPHHVELIVSGFACRYKILPDGRRQIMAYLLPGDFCDLHTFFLKAMDHSIATLSPCRVVRIARRDIQNI